MSSNESNAPAARVKREPDAKMGDVAVWLEPRTDNPEKFVATITVGNKGEQKQYYKANTEVNGLKLDANEILHLFIGDDITAEFQGPSSRYKATLAKKEVVRKPWKNNPEKFDQWMNIGMAFHAEKEVVRGGQKTGEKEHWGFRLSKGKGPEAISVTYPRTVTHGDKKIELSLAQIFQLDAKQDVKIGDVTIKLDHIEQKGKFNTARLAASSAAPAQVVSEGDTVPVNDTTESRSTGVAV